MISIARQLPNYPSIYEVIVIDVRHHVNQL